MLKAITCTFLFFVLISCDSSNTDGVEDAGIVEEPNRVDEVIYQITSSNQLVMINEEYQATVNAKDDNNIIWNITSPDGNQTSNTGNSLAFAPYITGQHKVSVSISNAEQGETIITATFNAYNIEYINSEIQKNRNNVGDVNQDGYDDLININPGIDSDITISYGQENSTFLNEQLIGTTNLLSVCEAEEYPVFMRG